MIEFIADCGHKVQVDDKLAGKIVKCAYCGREVETPSPEKSAAEFLLQEVDLNALARSEGPAQQQMTIAGAQREAGHESYIDLPDQKSVLRWFLIAGYLAIGAVVVVFAGKAIMGFGSKSTATTNTTGATQGTAIDVSNIPTHTGNGGSTTPLPTGTTNHPTNNVATTPQSPARPFTGGRINQAFGTDGQGVFVETFSSRASIYIRSEEARDQREVLGVDKAEFKGNGPRIVMLAPGRYRLAVVMLADDEDLTRLPGYDEVRSRLEFERDARVLQRFFALDRAAAVEFVDQVGVEPRIVKYYDIDLQPNQYLQVSALFVPGGDLHQTLSYLPTVELYQFDRMQVRSLLESAQVASSDLDTVLDLLARCGQIVYPLANEQYQLLQITADSGEFSNTEWQIAESMLTSGDELDHDPQPSGPTKGTNPWGGGAGRATPSTPTGEAPPTDLASVIEKLRARIRANQKLTGADISPYLSGGEYYTLWPSAEIRIRTTLVEICDEAVINEIIEPLGQTMLDDPDLDVRLAIVQAMVRAKAKGGLSYIDRRLKALEDQGPADSPEVKQEKKELQKARRTISSAKGSGGGNPWQ
ncbi:MAG: hypothetical protein HJJLKODD_02570 [Phycisphaerae bacterium]|nr:hypothetical protein [Phycisphaerae bacterium]